MDGGPAEADYLAGPQPVAAAGSSRMVDVAFDEAGNPRPNGTPVQVAPMTAYRRQISDPAHW